MSAPFGYVVRLACPQRLICKAFAFVLVSVDDEIRAGVRQLNTSGLAIVSNWRCRLYEHGLYYTMLPRNVLDYRVKIVDERFIFFNNNELAVLNRHLVGATQAARAV
jgi:hypothetical protein